MNPAATLWLTDADVVPEEDLARYVGWLSPGEVARCQRFVRAQRRRQFVIGRVLLRMALAPLLGVAPKTVRLEEQAGCAPGLAAPVPPGAAPGFSIAHSGRWVACAVSAQTALGLDIELRDAGRDLPALAAQAFDAGEMLQWQRVMKLPEAQRVDGFYRLWSEKEARFKLGLEGGYCVALPHPALSVVVCSALPLAPAPRIELISLA
jgi:4'-phosphopantetheinyl transferase